MVHGRLGPRGRRVPLTASITDGAYATALRPRTAAATATEATSTRPTVPGERAKVWPSCNNVLFCFTPL